MDDRMLLDEINIKTFPEIIIDYLKSKDINTNFNNLRSFYSIILGSINSSVKESYLNRILKYLSSKEASEILILDDISNGIYKKEIISALTLVHEDISKITHYNLFYKKLTELCKFIYFDKEEASIVNNAFNKEDYIEELYLLFIHACRNYQTNTPNILAERLLKDSFSILEGKGSKYALLKASADLGNEIACQIYANSILNRQEQVKYYIKGKALPQNIWELGFVIEHYNITQSLYDSIKKEFKDIINKGESYLTDPIEVINTTNTFEIDCTILALDLYLYLANEKKLSKAYNSVGKFFLLGTVSYLDDKGKRDKKKTDEFGLSYLKESIKLCNINAIQNYATYYYENATKCDFDLKEILKIGALLRDSSSCIYLSRILLDENKPNEAEEYVKYIADGNTKSRGEFQYKLAKIYENKLQTDDAIKYYEKAINNNEYLASFDLAKLYFNKAMMDMTSKNNRNGYLLMSINLIDSYYEQYTKDIKKEADLLRKNMKKILDE